MLVEISFRTGYPPVVPSPPSSFLRTCRKHTVSRCSVFLPTFDRDRVTKGYGFGWKYFSTFFFFLFLPPVFYRSFIFDQIS